MKKTLLAASLFAASVALPTHAAVIVSEVAPWSSGNSSLGADWFELTNTGAAAVDIAGWKVDDSSNALASAVALNGVASIAPGQSVIFIEAADLAAATTSFINIWFGGTAPAGLAIGNYSGPGIGLSTAGDAVNIFNAGGTAEAGVTFGASPASSPFATFDNAAGLSGAISQLSVVGVNGAFSVADGSSTLIGSPGTIGAVAPIPEPGTYALMLAGLALFGAIARRRLN